MLTTTTTTTMTTRDWAELRILRAELLDAHRELIRARTQTEQLIVSNRDLSSLLASASSQAGELLKMSVAFRRLSEAGDAAAALWAIEDVAINVVGTEDFVVLACGAKATLHAIAGKGRAFDDALHQAPTLAQLRKADDRVVPLWFGGKVVGALVIRTLLEHRGPLTQADEQVLKLVSHFASTAIVAWGESRDQEKAVARLAS
jgi:GAF domain-containing protein